MDGQANVRMCGPDALSSVCAFARWDGLTVASSEPVPIPQVARMEGTDRNVHAQYGRIHFARAQLGWSVRGKPMSSHGAGKPPLA